MADLDLTQGRWRLHRMTPQVMSPADMGVPASNGTNTDFLLQVIPTELGLSVPPPNTLPTALQGPWYEGIIEKDDPRHDMWDNKAGLGTFLIKLYLPTNKTRYFIQITEADWPAPGATNTTGENPVRIYMGRYFANQRLFFGYGADNWGSETLTFTFTYEDWPPQS